MHKTKITLQIKKILLRMTIQSRNLKTTTKTNKHKVTLQLPLGAVSSNKSKKRLKRMTKNQPPKKRSPTTRKLPTAKRRAPRHKMKKARIMIRLTSKKRKERKKLAMVEDYPEALDFDDLSRSMTTVIDLSFHSIPMNIILIIIKNDNF